MFVAFIEDMGRRSRLYKSMKPKLTTAEKVERKSSLFFDRARRHQFVGGRISNLAFHLADIVFIA